MPVNIYLADELNTSQVVRWNGATNKVFRKYISHKFRAQTTNLLLFIQLLMKLHYKYSFALNRATKHGQKAL